MPVVLINTTSVLALNTLKESKRSVNTFTILNQ